MQLQDLYIYPIKSLGGVRSMDAQVKSRGFHLDRRWMLVDESGRFLSQRTFHHMALLQVSIAPQGLGITHKLLPGLSHFVPYEPKTEEYIPVTIWGDKVIGQVVHPASNEWFSRILKIPCRLVFMASSSNRPIQKEYAINQETVSFADSMPYLIIGQKSLDHLNEKLPNPVPMERFRPNLVFSGGGAFQEDNWKQVKIGECTFEITKPCARCIMTTVDQETAEKGTEPLKTLAQYRTMAKKVLFGQNMIALTKGKVKVGDPVQPLY